MTSSEATGGLQNPPVVSLQYTQVGYNFTVWLFKGDAQFPKG